MEFDILGGSGLYRLLGRILAGIENSVRQSAIARLIMAVRAWAVGSVIVRGATRLADGVGVSIQNSAILGRLLREDEVGCYRERGIVFRLYLAVLEFLRWGFRKLKVDRLLGGSVLLRPYLWVICVLAMVPLMPTMALLGLVLLSAFSLVLTMLKDQTRTLAYSAVNKYVWFYMMIYGLATLTSVTPRESLPVGLITVAFVLFYQVLVSGITTRRQVRVFIGLIAGVGALVSVYGILQFFNPGLGAPAWLDAGMFDWDYRVYSTMENPNVLGKYFLLVIPLTLSGLFISRTRQGRFYYLASVGLMCICLVLTYSRGAYLGILFAAAVFFLLLDRRFIVPGILGVIVIFLLLPDAVVHRFLSIGDLGDTSTNYRVFIWMGTLSMLRDYWFSGIGPGEAAWAAVYPAYAFHAIITPHSHNLFLQITTDTGAPGILVFLAILYQYFKTTFAALRRKIQGEQRVLVIGAIAAIVGFVVMSMTDYTFYNYRVMLLFWAVLAIGVTAVRYDKLPERGEPS